MEYLVKLMGGVFENNGYFNMVIVGSIFVRVRIVFFLDSFINIRVGFVLMFFIIIFYLWGVLLE